MHYITCVLIGNLLWSATATSDICSLLILCALCWRAPLDTDILLRWTQLLARNASPLALQPSEEFRRDRRTSSY